MDFSSVVLDHTLDSSGTRINRSILFLPPGRREVKCLVRGTDGSKKLQGSEMMHEENRRSEPGCL